MTTSSAYITADLEMDLADVEDATLIELIVQGQESALEGLYRRYNRLVYSLAYRIVGDRATTEEVVLDVFSRIWERAAMYQPDQGKVSTWLSAITRNMAIDVLRRRGSRPEQHSVCLEDVAPIATATFDGPEKAAARSLRRDRILDAMSELSADQRRALALAYFGGYTHRQIAEALDAPLGTVKTRIRSAMGKLRHSLKEEWATG